MEWNSCILNSRVVLFDHLTPKGGYIKVVLTFNFSYFRESEFVSDEVHFLRDYTRDEISEFIALWTESLETIKRELSDEVCIFELHFEVVPLEADKE